MAKLDPYVRQCLSAERSAARSEFGQAKAQHAGARTDAERKKALKDMSDAAATIARCSAQLKVR